MGDTRVVLVKPGDVLVFGNLGQLAGALGQSDTAALADLKDKLGLAAVCVFEADIDIAAVSHLRLEHAWVLEKGERDEGTDILGLYASRDAGLDDYAKAVAHLSQYGHVTEAPQVDGRLWASAARDFVSFKPYRMQSITGPGHAES